MVGVSYADVPLSVLDEISRSTRSLPSDLVIEPHAGVTGAVLLSTCNRVEIYLDAEEPRRAAEAVATMFARRVQVDVEVPTPRVGVDVARHLFSVAAGLESMVVGEDEVSGQVRRALQQAQEGRTVSSPLQRLFQGAAATSKRVSATTGLGAAGRSIASVAVDLVEEQDGPLAGRPVLVIGTGAFARVVHATVVRRGSQAPMVFSSSGRAARFVESHGGVAIDQAGLMDALTAAELVVSCSGAPHPILDAHTLRAVTSHRTRPLHVLDLALTRDVDDAARSLDAVRVIDLEAISAHAPQEHVDALADARALVNDAVDRFSARESERSADGVIVAMRAHVQALMDRERDRVQHRLPADVAAEVEASLRHFVGELMHEPTIRAQQSTRDGTTAAFEKSVRDVFGIEISAAPA